MKNTPQIQTKKLPLVFQKCGYFHQGPLGKFHAVLRSLDIKDENTGATIDLDDLERKAAADDIKWFMLSHMRGHITHMDRIMEICDSHNLSLIEDCAHTAQHQPHPCRDV